MHQYCQTFGEDSLKTLALMGEEVGTPNRFFEDGEKNGDAQRRRFQHTFSAILSIPFLKVLSPGRVRSGRQVRSIDPTS